MRGNREVKLAVALIAANQAAGAVNGPALDLHGYDVCEIGITYGTPGGGGTHDTKLQHAVEDPASPGTPLASDWGDVPSGALAQVNAAGLKVIQVDPRSVKRYIRVVNTVGTATSPVGAIAARRHGHNSQPETVADLVVGFT